VIARVAVAAVALVALAWLGVMERDVRLEARGIDAARRLSDPGSFARAEADLRGARRLNPDTGPDFSRALLYQAAGRSQRAAALVEDIVRREPDNRLAWGLLRAIARDRDPATAARALAEQRRLDPVNARRLR
jgi:predicted Zn-dependent protease